MFCSNRCLDEFFLWSEKFSELKFSDSIIQTFLPSIFKALGISGGYQELEEIYVDPTSTSVFDYDLTDLKNSKTKLNLLKCAASLKNRKEENSFVSSIVQNISQQMQINMPTKMPSRSAEILNNFFRRHISIGASNAMGYNNGRTQLVFASLLNHSCDPTCQLTWINTKAVLFMNRPLKAQKQLFIAYK
jgi:SET domain